VSPMAIDSLQQGAVGLIALAIITAVTRVVLVYLSLRGAPPETRSQILKSLAVVFQSFGLGRLHQVRRSTDRTFDPGLDEPSSGDDHRKVDSSDPP
jgi:hypothetical protein